MSPMSDGGIVAKIAGEKAGVRGCGIEVEDRKRWLQLQARSAIGKDGNLEGWRKANGGANSGSAMGLRHGGGLQGGEEWR